MNSPQPEMDDSEHVWFVVGAKWPSDNNLNNIQPRSIVVIPEKESSPSDSASSFGAGAVVAIAFAVLVIVGLLALISDGLLIRRRRAATPADVEAKGERRVPGQGERRAPGQGKRRAPGQGEQRAPGPDGGIVRERHGSDARPQPKNPPAAGEGQAVPGARPAAWKQLGWTASVAIRLTNVVALVWALCFLCFSLARLGPYFQQYELFGDEALKEITRVRIFQLMLVLKIVCNLQLLVTITYPLPFWLKVRVYYIFTALLCTAYYVLAVMSMVYLKHWGSWLQDNGDDDLATTCLVGFWSEFAYLTTVSVALMIIWVMHLQQRLCLFLHLQNTFHSSIAL